MALNEKQLEILFRPINPKRVKKNPQGYSYVEEWDIEAHLTRIFGFLGWDKEITYGLIFEQDLGEGRWTVGYHAHCKLTIRDADGFAAVKEDGATGSGINQKGRAAANDLALKDAISSAVKRAAKALGNQFGLSLYDDGSQRSVVGTSLAYPPLETDGDDPVSDPEKVREQAAQIRDRMTGDRPETQDATQDPDT